VHVVTSSSHRISLRATTRLMKQSRAIKPTGARRGTGNSVQRRQLLMFSRRVMLLTST